MSRAWPRIAIVGAGFGGIAAAVELRRAGFSDVTLFDKDTAPGGTWQVNTYPGVECDVPSHLYSFSFRLNGGWSRKWSPRTEILAYLHETVRELGLEPLLRLGVEIVAGDYDEERGEWTLHDATGARYAFDVVVFALGQLNRPRWPTIEGLDRFDGPRFHSARWRHDVDLDGKAVAVVGNAASAVQLVPQLAPRVARLTVYQRSANWMLPKRNRRYLAAERWLARHVPGVARLYRTYIWLYAETLVYPLTGSGALTRRLGQRLAARHLRTAIADDGLRAALTPDYPIGAKRILFSDDYYPALARDNVDLVTTPIRRAGADYLECEDGTRRHADAVVLATGFRTTEFLAPVRLRGRGGLAAEDVWRDGARAYLGVASAGFPNLFMIYGPNTNLGHSSIIMMLECQARYVAACLRHMRRTGARQVEIREDRQRDFNHELAVRLAGKVWASVAESWYLRDGRNTNNWPGTTIEYWWRTRRFVPDDYRLTD